MSDAHLASRHRHRTILISGACGVTSRTVVRALRKSPLFDRTRLVGMDVCDNPYGLYEGLYDRVYRVSPCRDEASYQHQVESLCAQERVDAAIVIPEPEVLFWAEHAMPVPALLPPAGFSRRAISKATLYETLRETGWVPRHASCSREEIRAGQFAGLDLQAGWPLWLRDASAGSTSGKGALCAANPAQAAAWMTLNPGCKQLMVNEYLPGRNLACLLLYAGGRLLKVGCYERLVYFMGHTAVSGVTGNIAQGRLCHEPEALSVAQQAIQSICALTGELMSGLVTVDFRLAADGRPLITEINLRPVAAASAFAEVPQGNLIEGLLLATLGEADAAGPLEAPVPPGNRILRDIDGAPIVVHDYVPLQLGAFIGAGHSQWQGVPA
jgi:carbamoyl-phosphate synthase large subunit